MLQWSYRTIAATAGVVLTSLLSIPQALANDLDFVVHNRTQTPIVGLYVSDSRADSWGGNILRNGNLQPGNSITVTFDGAVTWCLFDIRAVFSDSDTSEKREVDLCKVSDFNFTSSAVATLPPEQLAKVAPTLRSIVPQIQATLPSGLAMRLPSVIEGVAYDGRKFPVYGIVLPVDSDQLTVQLAATPDCDVRACLVGYIAVAPRGSRSLPAPRLPSDKSEPIQITSTIRGKYVYLTFPGAASTPPTNVIVWEQGGFAYVVSSGMNKQKVLDIAKSMAAGVVIQRQ